MAPTDLGDGVCAEAMLPLYYQLPRSLGVHFGVLSILSDPSMGRSHVGGLILSSGAAASLASYPSFKNRRCCAQFSLLS